MRDLDMKRQERVFWLQGYKFIYQEDEGSICDGEVEGVGGWDKGIKEEGSFGVVGLIEL